MKKLLFCLVCILFLSCEKDESLFSQNSEKFSIVRDRTIDSTLLLNREYKDKRLYSDSTGRYFCNKLPRIDSTKNEQQ